jgi:short-subunit dehydrogenase
VNFFGAARVTRAVLPTMRAQRSGRVVFVSSVVGFVPAPFMGFYAASKHALEGYSESLDHEVRALGIRAILVEPGYMKTKFDKNATVAARTIGDYSEARERVGATSRRRYIALVKASLVGRLSRATSEQSAATGHPSSA